MKEAMENDLLIWMAGFFEGEGCVSCDRQGKSFQLSIDQFERELLEPFKEMFGGCIVISHRERPNGWKWRITHRKALRFAVTIKPFIRGEKTRNKLQKIIDRYEHFSIHRAFDHHIGKWRKLGLKDQEQFIMLWQKGATYKELMARFSICYMTVYHWTKYAKLSRRI